MPKTPAITIVSNPAAFGAEWDSPESDSRYSLSVSRGSSVVYFGARIAGRWSTVPVTDPSRFGPIPDSNRSMRAYALAFVTAGDDTSDDDATETGV